MTVCCVWVRGEYPFTADYVRRLLAMAGRYLDRPFRFVCLTDQPGLMPTGVEPVTIGKFPGCLAYWNKLQVFNPEHEFSGRMLYLDLDTLIVGPLEPIVDVPAPFALIADPPKHGQKGLDRFRRTIVRRFNSSVMVWDAGLLGHLYASWTPAVAGRLSGDQDHIAEQAPEAFGLDPSWFPRLSQVSGPPFSPSAKVILSKHPKNHVAASQLPWFAPLWGAAA